MVRTIWRPHRLAEASQANELVQAVDLPWQEALAAAQQETGLEGHRAASHAALKVQRDAAEAMAPELLRRCWVIS